MADDDDVHDSEVLEPSHDRSLSLGSGYRIDVLGPAAGERAHEELVLRTNEGQICLRITLTPEGPAVSVEAASLSLQSRGAMTLSAREVSIESEGGLALRSGGDLRLESERSMELRAREQHLEATHGDVHVEANDDVRVDGERVRLNSPDAAPLRRPGAR